MATPPNQSITINGQTFYSRPCRFENNCLNYNPALKIPITLTIRGKQVGATEKLNPCTTGGGCACSDFVRKVGDAIYLNGGLR
jgi:hypothetical protein